MISGQQVIRPWPDDVCTSMYDGCLCELEPPHPGVDHQCSSVHELQKWTTEQGEDWVRKMKADELT